jgi:putative membrane protein
MMLGGLTMLIFWGGLILLSVWAVSRVMRQDRGGYHESPLDIAKRRLAAGEITPEQYEAIRKTLGA